MGWYFYKLVVVWVGSYVKCWLGGFVGWQPFTEITSPPHESRSKLLKWSCLSFTDKTAEVTAFKLMSFLPSNKTFYRYLGSLTTPQCQESVTWTVFENSIEVSAQQVNPAISDLPLMTIKRRDGRGVEEGLVLKCLRKVRSTNARLQKRSG